MFMEVRNDGVDSWGELWPVPAEMPAAGLGSRPQMGVNTG